jgi:hypothetical protein
MANQEYKLIEQTSIELNGKHYSAQTFNMNLETFLKQNAGKQIYILHSSILTENIRAIVL